MNLEHRLRNIYSREAPLKRVLEPHLEGRRSVIDIGAGGGKLAKLISARLDKDVTLLDVVDHNVTDLPLIKYDGSTMPFPDDMFDVALLVFTLHHAADPTRLIAEASRVAGGHLLVVEDTPRNYFEYKMWRFFDDMMNNHTHSDIALAEQAHSAVRWAEIFEQQGFIVRSISSFRTLVPVLATYQHTLFVLEQSTA